MWYLLAKDVASGSNVGKAPVCTISVDVLELHLFLARSDELLSWCSQPYPDVQLRTRVEIRDKAAC